MSDYNAWFQQRRAERESEFRARLEQAKTAARASGKETLDLARVENLWPHNPYARLGAAGVQVSPREKRRNWEHSYYLLLPELRTLAAFVEKMKALDQEGAFD